VLGVDDLKPILLLFSLEIPLFSLARCHTHVLVGLERFRERAWASAARWASRVLLAIAFVELGLGVNGAVLGALGSTALELIVARRFIQPRWGLPSPPELRRRLVQYSRPLFLHGISLQLFNRLGLLLLVPLGASVAAAGVYGAADAPLRLRRVLGQSLTPMVLSTLSGMLRDGQQAPARGLARGALRAAILTAGPVAVVAGAAPRIMAWLYGEEFRQGGSWLAILIAGAPGFLVISIAAAILIAAGRPEIPVRVTAPMVPLALVGCLWAVPRYGGAGAAAVTTLTVVAAALASLERVYRVWRIAPPVSTVVRSAVVATGLYLAAAALPHGGAWLMLELPALAVLGVALYLVLGEASADELGRLRRVLSLKQPA
jgi:O-antigen/teichoic acid export membrane protein